MDCPESEDRVDHVDDLEDCPRVFFRALVILLLLLLLIAPPLGCPIQGCAR